MRLRRLASMGLDEMAVRGRQGFLKWAERFGAVRAVVRAAGEAGLTQPPSVLRQRFFEGASSPRTPDLVAAADPSEIGRILDAAERIHEGRFDLLGFRGLWFGDPIDWHLDPLSGVRGRRVHWSRLRPIDPIPGGDPKVVWELNRLQWLVTLGQAWRISGDERHGSVFAKRVEQWIESNPAGIGINWASSLELAFRIISWSWALVLFEGCASLDARLRSRIIASIAEHAAHIERHLSLYSSPNTHLTGEALGLFYAGLLFPTLARASRWRDLAVGVIEEQSHRQILEDGVYFEQSTCYQRYTIEIYLHYLILSATWGAPVPAELRRRLGRMIEALLAFRRPDGSIAPVGDADGGRLLPLSPGAPDDARAIFSTAAALSRRPDWAWAGGGLSPETVWLLGPRGALAHAAIEPEPPGDTRPKVFPHGGYVIMRSGWTDGAHHLIFDVGPLGSPVSSAHGHADLLSVQCCVYGQPFLIDPGTGRYAAERTWRDFFRGGAAHNTISVDGAEQAEPATPFSWRQRPQASLDRLVSETSFDFADARHESFHRLRDPVTHRRRVLFVRGRYWLLVDDLIGGARHRADLRFMIDPARQVTVTPQGWVRIGSETHELLMSAFSPAHLALSLHRGGTSPICGWASGAYGLREPAPSITWSFESQLPARVATLLIPARRDAPLPEVTPVHSDEGQLIGLVLLEQGETILIDDESIRPVLAVMPCAGSLAS